MKILSKCKSILVFYLLLISSTFSSEEKSDRDIVSPIKTEEKCLPLKEEKKEDYSILKDKSCLDKEKKDASPLDNKDCNDLQSNPCLSPEEKMGCPVKKEALKEDLKIVAIIFASEESFFAFTNLSGAMGIIFNDVYIPGNKNLFSSTLEKAFIGKPISDTKIQEIKEKITSYFYEHNYPDVKLKISNRYKEDGIIRVVIQNRVVPEKTECKDISNPCESTKYNKDLCENDYNLILKDCDKKNISSLHFKAIVISDDEKILLSNSFEEASKVVFIKMDPPFEVEDISKRLERLFIDKPITETKIEELKKSLKGYYDEYAHPDVNILVLLSEIKDGIVKVLVKDNTPNYCSKLKEQKDKLTLKAIVLIGKEELKNHSFDTARGVVLSCLNLPGNRLTFTEKMEKLFIGKKLTKECILEIKHQIILYYKENGRPVVAVSVPDQNITKGILLLIVKEGILSDISIVGNRYFSDEQYKKYISLKPGYPIDENDLINDVNFINRNPFRNVDIIYKPGEYPSTTEVELSVREIRPVRAYAGIDNTGLDLIGKNRYMAGIHLGNLFWQDQVLSYQITKSFDSHSFEAHTFQYTIPLPWKNIIFIYGGYSRVHAQIPRFPTGKSKGKSYQASFRYDLPLPVYKNMIHDVTLGFDFKRTDNSVEFSNQIQKFASNVNLTQIMLSYEVSYDRGLFQLQASATGFFSPGRWLHDQSNKRYNALRPHAKNHYLYTRESFKALVHLPKNFSWSLLMDMQFSNHNLLASEEFGIGGYNTVRGYDEHQVNEDNGILISSELRSASFGVFHNLLSKKIADHFQLLGFIDYGKGWVDQREKRLRKSQYLWSLGPGLRYIIDPFLALRLDWGFKLKRKNYSGSKTKLHFGLNISF